MGNRLTFMLVVQAIGARVCTGEEVLNGETDDLCDDGAAAHGVWTQTVCGTANDGIPNAVLLALTASGTTVCKSTVFPAGAIR